MAKAKHDYKYHIVYYGDGTKGSLKIAKGRLASPAFWESVEAAETSGASYCGHHNGRADPAEMVTRFQCLDCHIERLSRSFSNYRPPRARQSLDATRAGQNGCYAPTAYRNDPDAHRRAWHQYRREDAERAASRAEALRIFEELESAEIPNFSTAVEDVQKREIPENGQAEDEPARSRQLAGTGEPTEDFYGLYDDETAARMAALRNELLGDE